MSRNLLFISVPRHRPHVSVRGALSDAGCEGEVEDRVGPERGGEHEAGQRGEDGAAFLFKK